MNNSRSTALAGLIAVMLVWGSTFVVTKAAVAEIPPLTLSMLRFLVAACVLVPIAVARGGLKRLTRPLPIGRLLLMSLTGITLFHVAFNYALLHGSAAQGALIFAILPAAIAVAAVIGLGEALARRRVVGIGLSVCGVAVVIAAGGPDLGSPDPLAGALWMLVAVAAWAVYTVLAKRLADADQVVVVACISVLGVAMQLPLAAWELSHVPWPSPTLRGWLGLLFLGVVASALIFVAYGRILRELDASLVGVFVNLDPIVGVLTAVLFLGETLGAGQIAGGLVAITGMWLASREGARSG